MSYRHLENLYRPEAQEILMFKECYAMEKLHGSSSHVYYKSSEDKIHYFAGGEKQVNFEALFDNQKLLDEFRAMGDPEIVVFGEVYGGKCQGMSYLYGKTLKFAAFEVKIGESWLSVPQAEAVVLKLGLEFVPYEKIPCTLEALDKERDRDSVQAVRNGVDLTKLPPGKTPRREGVVLRPLIELRKNNGERISAKHKSEEFNKERKTPQKVVDPSKLVVLEESNAIAEEWCTLQRLEHILQKLPQNLEMKDVPEVIKAMIEDILREGSGEIVDSKEARKAIGNRAVRLFKQHLEDKLKAIA